MSVRIAPARPEDCATVFALIRALAEYERLSHLVVGTEQDLRSELFGAHPVIESVVAWDDDRAVGFALFFHNYSTFLARRGLYLEDLFVVPEARGRGIGKALIAPLRARRRDAWLRTLRVERAGLERAGDLVLPRRSAPSLLPDWRICRLTGESLQRFGERRRSGAVNATP